MGNTNYMNSLIAVFKPPGSSSATNQFLIDSIAHDPSALALAPLAWMIGRHNRLGWRQDKHSRLFLPSWFKRD